MPFERAIWSRPFTEREVPPWRCPMCHHGYFRLVKDTLHKAETAESRRDHSNEAWEPTWIDGRFSCLMRCNSCGEPTAIAGMYRVDETFDPDEGPEVWDAYQPSYFSSAPHLIDIPDAAPEEIADELRKSFQVFWHDAEACANHIRSGVEQVLTAKGVKRTEMTKRGRRRLSLHRRIGLFEQRQPAVAKALMAIKWIGNAGSHAQQITEQDLLDGYELMDHILSELFVQRAKAINRLSASINRRRKPRSAHPK